MSHTLAKKIFSDGALFEFLYIEKPFQLPIQIQKMQHSLFAKQTF